MKTIEKDPSLIPEGMYCYKNISVTYGDDGFLTLKKENCPYHSIRKDKPYQDNGYCSYLEYGDWMDSGLSLLWDQCKECGINDYD